MLRIQLSGGGTTYPAQVQSSISNPEQKKEGGMRERGRKGGKKGGREGMKVLG